MEEKENDMEKTIQHTRKGFFSLIRKIGRVIGMLISTFLVIIVLLLFVFLLISSGKIKPITDQSGRIVPGSISEKVWVKINGLDQGLIIQSRNPENPVLLFMHGGPGMPEYFLTEQYPTGLENDFTVVWWDQRGAGLSYDSSIDSDTMTVEQYISDTIEITNYLRNRFHKEKIFLMAQSGGSFFAIQAAQREPELFYAYIGVGQIVYQMESEQIAFDYMLEQYRLIGDVRMVKQLEAARPAMKMPLPKAYDRMRDDAMHGIGIGTTRDMKTVEWGVFVPSLLSNQYTIDEKIDLWRGKVYCSKQLRNEVFSTDLRNVVRSLEIPTFFISGKYDYTVNHDLSEAYLGQLDAPVKEFYLFENSAHSPFFEEPDRFRSILQQIVLASE